MTDITKACIRHPVKLDTTICGNSISGSISFKHYKESLGVEYYRRRENESVEHAKHVVRCISEHIDSIGLCTMCLNTLDEDVIIGLLNV